MCCAQDSPPLAGRSLRPDFARRYGRCCPSGGPHVEPLQRATGFGAHTDGEPTVLGLEGLVGHEVGIGAAHSPGDAASVVPWFTSAASAVSHSEMSMRAPFPVFSRW